MDGLAIDGPRELSGAFSRRELSGMASQLAQSPIACAVTEGAAHTVRYSNAAFRELVRTGEITTDPPPPIAERVGGSLTSLLDRALCGETVRDELLASPAGAPRWSCSAWIVESATATGLVVAVRDTAELSNADARQRSLAERLLLGALRERDATQRAIEAEGRASFLATASHSLARSLDENAIRKLLQRSMLPREGTWCIVDLIETNGTIHRLAVVHPDPKKQHLARELADAWYQTREDPVDPLSVGRLAGGRPVVLTRDSGSALVSAAHGPENLAVLRRLGFGSLLVAPLVGRDAVIGTLTFVSAEGDDEFTADEIALASDLADRGALALENARLYRETDSLRAAADNANRAKSELLRDVGHELRTPLYAISAYVELLDKTHGSWSAEQRSDLDRIKHNQRHLLNLISQLVDFGQSETGRVEYHLAEVSVRAALAEVSALLGGAARERDLTLDYLPGVVDACVWADSDRVRQILLNLVMNGVKYTPLGGGGVTLGFTAQNDAVLIQISDRGPGIPAERLEAIFEQFVRFPSDEADRQGGLGLGLGISRNLARAMGGDLTAESAVGVGSRFTLTLPRVACR